LEGITLFAPYRRSLLARFAGAHSLRFKSDQLLVFVVISRKTPYSFLRAILEVKKVEKKRKSVKKDTNTRKNKL
jgi:hypothetical protein